MLEPVLERCMNVGVISDTHGLLRAEALAALQGCERIIHAGDIGNPEILDHLASIAPLYVVRGIWTPLGQKISPTPYVST